MLTMNVRLGSNSLIRRYWLNVRFARSGHGWAIYEYTPLDSRTCVLAPSKDRELRPQWQRACELLSRGPRAWGAAGRGGFETRRNGPISESASL